MFHPTVLLICGLLHCISAASAQPEAKIVGGTAAPISKVPYQVSLQTNGRHFCGAAIYNVRILITAAHCANAVSSPSQIVVRYGSQLWSSGGTLIGVTKAVVHPNFNADTLEYDVALLKTDRDIVWSSNVLAVNLALREIAGGTKAIISGWGTWTAGVSSVPNQLTVANVNIIERSTCQSKSYGYGTNVASTMICAGETGADSCQGDSGGPLVVGGWLVGIVSWGTGCASSFYPGVYTSVPVLRNFIVNNAKIL